MAQVTRTTRPTPQTVRVTLGGLEGFGGAGLDHWVKLFFPLPGEHRPVYPTGDDWWRRWGADPDAVRAVFRTYTVRRHRPEAGEIDIDFVLHGDTAPGSRWAARAKPGDQVGVWGPGAMYDPSPAADWRLIAGDETALPAMAAIIETLPAGARARVFVEVADAAEEQRFATDGDVRVEWLHRDGVPAGRSALLVDRLRAADLPDGRPYAWIAGEAAMVKALRRHLVNDRGIDRADICFSGYWRLGKTEYDE
ncbi:siderophore-interacting protein [Actinomadura alba]|uniref:Siderophore-interacting protein n=2 Tax=Actinomadura alba TaxID=406431 RepID=A0ABR7LSW2_9ACTN|nr:siderophore-interacting protein [Actinomadura alba]